MLIGQEPAERAHIAREYLQRIERSLLECAERLRCCAERIALPLLVRVFTAIEICIASGMREAVEAFHRRTQLARVHGAHCRELIERRASPQELLIEPRLRFLRAGHRPG